MSITCASPLTTTSSTVTVPGSVTLRIDLANEDASSVADLEFVLLDPTLAVCFHNGARVERVQRVVPNVGLAVSVTLSLACCKGNLHGVNTVLPIGLNVFEGGVLRCAPSTVVTVKSHACAEALVPLHSAKASPIVELFAPGITALKTAKELHAFIGDARGVMKQTAKRTVKKAAKKVARKGATRGASKRTGKQEKQP